MARVPPGQACRQAAETGSGRRCDAPAGVRLLSTLVHLRHGVTHDVLACWFGGERLMTASKVPGVGGRHLTTFHVAWFGSCRPGIKSEGPPMRSSRFRS
ncbi:transposase family protein [Streptomyces sp. NPDC013187]|uniref:transposase family protein n=1 Tax=Streptomyces sp. NPDC013187 TaxID=3364865 RepID=UPI0036849700